MFTLEQIQSHNTENDCWIIIRGNVYNVSKFEHPGGKKVLLDHAGKDATKIWESLHDVQLLETVAKKFLIGQVETIEKESFHIPYADPAWYFSYSPYFNESHVKLREFARDFTQKHLGNVHEWSESDSFPSSVRKIAGELGILHAACGVVLPNTKLPLNIKEWDVFHSLCLFDEISRCGSGGAVWGLYGGLGIGLPPVLKFGSKSLIEKYAPQCISGDKVICLCVTEPSAGSDVANIQTKAVLKDDYYVLNGEKKWITNGVYADYFTVACRTGESGMKGISLLLVERTKGVKTQKVKCSGMWGSGTAYITFENVLVPKSNLIGKENHGFMYIMHNFNNERVGMVIQAVRFSRVCFEISVLHSMRRKTFGKKLIEHAVIRQKLAAMAGRIEAVYSWLETLLYQSSKMEEKERMLRLGGPIALLKSQASLLFEFCAREATQILGGRGYTRSGQGKTVEQLYREVRAYAIPGGSEEIMQELGIRQSLRVAKMFNPKM